MTLATTIGYVRRILEEDPFEDTLSAQLTSGATSMSVNDSTNWFDGDIAEEQGAGQQILVKTNGSGGTVSVKMGHNGTTVATVASGTVLVKNPAYAYNQVENAIAETCNTLWPRIWVQSSTTVTPSASADIYNLPSDYGGFIAINQTQLGSITEIRTPIVVQEIPPVSTGLLASGRGLRIRGWHRTDANATLTYKAIPTTTNMPTALERLVARGAAAKLLKGRAARWADQVEIGEQSRVRNLLTTARFLEDEFEQGKVAYRATLHPTEGQVRRYVRRTFIGA